MLRFRARLQHNNGAAKFGLVNIEGSAMPDQVLIPLPGIGTLPLTRAVYEAALIPISSPAVPRPTPSRRAEPIAAPPAITASEPPGLRYLRLSEVCKRVGVGHSTIYRMMALFERTSVWIQSEAADEEAAR
jgi:hypothetical protein